jgi:glutathione S-transferase
MAITLYDLAGVEADRRFSPFCWRTRMALAHKGLEVETVPWRFTEKDRLPQPNAGRVPVIVDGGQVVHDSSTIAEYLENRYPDRPSLFPGEAGHALTRFIQNWTETVLQPGLIGFVVLDIHRHIGPEDQAYFRQSREERFGRSLEEVVKDRDARLAAFRVSLTPLRRTVERQNFLGADYIVFGAFQWARAISDYELLAADDPVTACARPVRRPRAQESRLWQLRNGGDERDRRSGADSARSLGRRLGGRHVLRTSGASAGGRGRSIRGRGFCCGRASSAGSLPG